MQVQTKITDDGPDSGKLGTFSGVFTPSVLTILGIILFLRLGFIVGNAGLGRALIIIAVANCISVLTSISLSAIATNLKVKGGGDYYLISRTLGVEFGGALGLVLFLAQSVSIAFYCIGFAEAVCALVPHSLVIPRIVAFVAVILLFVVAWLGADVATRFQFVIMAILGAALLSFYIGAFMRWDASLLAVNWRPPENGMDFWVLFAIFFPAVTGFTQGVSMSGDLADPGRSLPRGTFMAVGVSILVYFSAAVLFAGTKAAAVLQHDYHSMNSIAAWSVLIDAGVIAATLSSAIASFLGAPRILQALASDRVFPFLIPFAKGYGDSNNPRRGVLLSGGIALVTIALGNLNVVASVVSMFFLISYGLLNYATYFEARAGSPSFRPRFRYFDQRLSLAGALACLGVMLAIDPVTGLAAIAILFAIYQYLKRTAGPARWADSRRSWHLQKIRENLRGLAEEPEHPRDWRPHILALSNDPDHRRHLLQLAEWIGGTSGFTTAVCILTGQKGAGRRRRAAEAEEELRRDIVRLGFSAFARVITISESSSVLSALIQSYGVGALRANTILLDWYSLAAEEEQESFYCRDRLLRDAYRLGCNLLISGFRQDDVARNEQPATGRRIFLWWQESATGRLSLLLAHLMTRCEQWEDARITVLTAEERFCSEEGSRTLAEEIEDSRIEVELQVLPGATFQQVLECSIRADFVFFPFKFRDNRIISLMDKSAVDLVSNLPASLLVKAAEDIDLDAEPESGEAAELAKIMDAAHDAEQKAEQAIKKASETATEARQAREKLQEAQASTVDGDGDELLNQAEKEANLAQQKAYKAARKAAKAVAKQGLAEKEAEQVKPPQKPDN